MFTQIVGNEENKRILEDIIKKDKTANSYMFIGIEGIGKKLFAEEFAKASLCLSKEKPCNECNSCIKFNNFNNPDFEIIEKDESSIKIDQIRNMIKKIQEKPIVSNRKVYIINDSDKMTDEAQNALLKTLEEPPSYAIIILIANNESSFLNTIKSRCTKIKFVKLLDNEIEKILLNGNNKKVDRNEYNIFEGSVKRALEIIEKQDLYEELVSFLEKINKMNLVETINVKEKIFKNKEDTNLTLEIMNNLLLKKRYVENVKIVEKAKQRLQKNANYDMTIDNLLMSMWEEING